MRGRGTAAARLRLMTATAACGACWMQGHHAHQVDRRRHRYRGAALLGAPRGGASFGDEPSPQQLHRGWLRPLRPRQPRSPPLLQLPRRRIASHGRAIATLAVQTATVGAAACAATVDQRLWLWTALRRRHLAAPRPRPLRLDSATVTVEVSRQRRRWCHRQRAASAPRRRPRSRQPRRRTTACRRCHLRHWRQARLQKQELLQQ